MKFTMTLLIKLIMSFAAAWISFSVFGYVGLSYVIVIALAATIFNYLIGDLLILPKFGNLVAAISDGILSAIISYAVLAAYTFYTTVSLMIFAVIIAVLEFFFHIFLVNAGTPGADQSVRSSAPGNKKLSFSAETAKEMHPNYRKNNDQNKD